MSPILAHFIIAMAAPHLTDAQISENIYQASRAVMIETACMGHMNGDDAADIEADTNPANWPIQVRSTIAFAREQGASLNPTRDQCVHLVYPINREWSK